MLNVAIFTDNDFEKVNGVTTTLRAVLAHAPEELDLRIYTCDSIGIEDGDYLSLGVVKVPAARPLPLGLRGFFLPTAALDASGNPVSVFPALGNPTLVLSAYEGDLQLAAAPSVYTLDTDKMTQLVTNAGGPVLLLKPGQTATLAGGKGTVTFTGIQRYAGRSAIHWPSTHSH